MLDERIERLKAIIAGNDGRNAADGAFARAVDELVSTVYDDIGEIREISIRALFDLFLIKVLYVGRHSSDARVIDYLGAMLDRYVYAREMFAPAHGGGARAPYFSDALAEAVLNGDRFAAYRHYADSALFAAGLFPPQRNPTGRTAGRMLGARAPRIDGVYYVTTGKKMYRMAASEGEAERTRQRQTLLKLAEYFELYVDALNEVSQRYILGFDMKLLADKMLDSFNRYRERGDQRALADARRYASILRLDRQRFPTLYSPSGSAA
jgi:hypothetical protein